MILAGLTGQSASGLVLLVSVAGVSMALLVLTWFAVGSWWSVPGAPGAGAVVLNVLIVGFLVWQALRWTPARDRQRTKA